MAKSEWLGQVPLTSDIQSYRDLQVWQKSMDLAEAAYRLVATFPRDEVYGMTSQLRRAAASIPANIAEGHGRELTGSFGQFLRMSQGSLKELETHLLLARRVSLTTERDSEVMLQKCDELGRMLRSLIRSLEAKL